MPDDSPFWLCYACGAQMRPLMIGDVPHCASCNSDFLEILDEEVNPDPLHELPHPGRRSDDSETRPSFDRPDGGEWYQYGQRAAGHPPPLQGERPVDTNPSLLNLVTEFLGVGAARPGARTPGSGTHTPDPRRPYNDEQYEYRAYDDPPHTHNHVNPHDHDHHHEHPSSPQQQPSGRGDSRQWRFNVGGGVAVVEFGGFGGRSGASDRNPWVGGYDGAPGDPSQGLDAYFRGFGAGAAPRRRQNIEGMDLLQALMALVVEEGGARTFLPQGANVGDYVMSEDGFNDVLERLMQVAGPQGPIPAPADVIRDLPRFTFTETTLKESAFDDCAVCKEDFVVGDKAMKLPCEHVYHEDCLVPWLERNGSCPVCRKSLVPENPRPQASRQNSQQAGPSGDQEEQQGHEGRTGGAGGLFASAAQTVVTGVLNRLFGQQGRQPSGSSAADSTAPAVPSSQPDSPERGPSDVPGPSTAAPRSFTRPDGPPDWYRNFFAPSPDPPRSGDSSQPPIPPNRPSPPHRAPSLADIEANAEAHRDVPDMSYAPQRQGIFNHAREAGDLPRRISTPSLGGDSPRESRRSPFPGAQEIRRTPSSSFRTPARTPTSSNSRSSTPGTYLYNPGDVGSRPSPLFARPFFQLPGQSSPAADTPPPASVPAAPDLSAGGPGAPSGAGEAWRQNETRGGEEWRQDEPRSARASPPPQLEQATQAERAEWGKTRPEDDPPEPLAEELNEYRQRQAERERRARDEETYVEDLD